MKTAALPRVVLILALAVLAGSLAVLGSVTGVVPETPSETGYEFVIEDERLIETSGDHNETLVADVSTVNRIKITNLDTSPVVSTTQYNPPKLTLTKQKHAKQIVTSNESISETLTSPDGAVYTIRPIPNSLDSERAAIVGVNPETRSTSLQPVGHANFTVQNETADDTVIFERTGRQMSNQRALVVVDPIQREDRYSVVVDLQNETIEAFVRFGVVSEYHVPFKH
jgi:hypothetical protein